MQLNYTWHLCAKAWLFKGQVNSTIMATPAMVLSSSRDASCKWIRQRGNSSVLCSGQPFRACPRWESESSGSMSLQSFLPALLSLSYPSLFSPFLCAISMASKWSAELKVCTHCLKMGHTSEECRQQKVGHSPASSQTTQLHLAPMRQGTPFQGPKRIYNHGYSGHGALFF